MPEGDTIFRTADALRRWLAGRVVTAAQARSPGVDAAALVGATVGPIEARGKHLLMTFAREPRAPDLVLRSHMRMTGSWHVYSAGDAWQRPQRQSTVVIRAGDRLAVGFNVPVIELTSLSDLRRVAALAALGPDVLAGPLDAVAAVRRARAWPSDRALGELLLDQRVVAGIGNVFRCEALFLDGLHPWTTLGQIGDATLAGLLVRSAALLVASVGSAPGRDDLGGALGRNFGLGPGRTWVYGRSGRPCRRCATLVVSRRQGEQARTAYWCPTCQPLA